MAINWHFFVAVARAMRIDTGIVDPLERLRDENIGLYVRSAAPHPPFSLAQRTLQRGVANRLSTGQEICKKLDLSEPTISVETTAPEQRKSWDPLIRLGFAENTPLWYYILLEAELKHAGRRLGPLGSRLLIDVIDGALTHDPESVLHTENDATHPFEWNGIEVKNLADVAKVVGLLAS
jgi:hypothetical protein